VYTRLAEEGMTVSFRARDVRVDRNVEILVPRPEQLEQLHPFFRRQIATLARNAHPNLHRLLDVGEHPSGLPYAVLEYLGGTNLSFRLFEDGLLEADDVDAWLSPVAGVLDHLHGAGVLHRDVKPNNVRFDTHGRAYLSGLHLARSSRTTGITATVAALGTPLYMAPEQVFGSDVGPAADQFALALTVFEALVGKLPWDSMPVMEMLQRRRMEPVDVAPLRKVRLPEDAVAAVGRALSPEPRDRFPTCTAFRDAFRAALVPPPAPPPARWSWKWRPKRN
jgi:serine/threonine protein kinase